MSQQELNLVEFATSEVAQPGTGAPEIVRGHSGAFGSVYTESVFEWDPRKASVNAAKHGVTFADTLAVFADADALDGPDLAHSASEARYLRLGRAADGRVLMVAYTIRRHDDAETIRLISARRASRRERAAYAAED